MPMFFCTNKGQGQCHTQNSKHRAKGYCVKHYNQMRWQRIKRTLQRIKELEARAKAPQVGGPQPIPGQSGLGALGAGA